MKTKQQTYNQWIKEEIKCEIKEYLKTSETRNTTYPNPWDPAKET